MRTDTHLAVSVESDEAITGHQIADVLTGHGWDLIALDATGPDYEEPPVPAGWIVEAEVITPPEPIVVVCVRDPDASNHYTTYPEGAPLRIIDIDLGYAALDDRDEYLEWAASQFEEHDSLPEGHPARQQIIEIVATWRENWHTEFSGIEDVRAAAEAHAG